MALTEIQVKNLALIGDRQEQLIADVHGLSLRLRAGKGGTSKVWQWRRKDGGKLAVKTLGSWPGVSLKQARLKAAELASKRDPTHSRTFEQAAEQWFEEIVDPSRKGAEHPGAHAPGLPHSRQGSRQ